jgi:hypothetical protein
MRRCIGMMSRIIDVETDSDLNARESGVLMYMYMEYFAVYTMGSEIPYIYRPDSSTFNRRRLQIEPVSLLQLSSSSFPKCSGVVH